VASIVAADLVLYHAATQSDVDGSTGRRRDRHAPASRLHAGHGGRHRRGALSNAGDTTQTLTIEARKADGTVVSETKTLTGTTAIVFSTIAASTGS
jgi:hypothetical protein